MSGRSVPVAVAGLLLLAGSGRLPVATTEAGGQSARVKCGEERWDVKTLSDPRASDVEFSPKTITVAELRRQNPPAIGTDTPRQPGVEETTLKVRARLVAFKLEDDRDVHLIIAQPHHAAKTMIVEFPDVRCEGARDSIKKSALRRSRRSLIEACGVPPSASSSFAPLRGKGTVTGVGFFDLLHGQTGVAPNGIELHPVLRFETAKCAGAV